MLAAELPISLDAVSIVDLETTGLSAAQGERIVEISIARYTLGGEPVVIFDTLVHPGGPVRGTSIHGITDDDVVGAPQFAEIAGDVLGHLQGTIVAAYNAAFDMAFLTSEFSLATRGEYQLELPYLCLMWMRPQLGLGDRCTLSVACECHGIPGGDHSARADAVAAARLWREYASVAQRELRTTFHALRGGRRGKFWDSLERPIPTRETWPRAVNSSRRPALKPRLAPQEARSVPRPEALPADRTAARRAYWHALLDVMEDDAVSPWEAVAMRSERERLGLDLSDVRAVHAKFFGNRLEALAEDQRVTDAEDEEIRRVHRALKSLGWAPGT